jgi:hypothetical protein
MHVKEDKICRRFWWANLHIREGIKGLGVDGTVIFKRALQKRDEKA